MKKYVRKLWDKYMTAETNSLSRKEELKKSIKSVIVATAIFVLSCFIPIASFFRIITVICVVLYILFMICFLSRVFITVSDNKEKYEMKNKKYKFKYEPVKVFVDDLRFWLENANVPETILVKSLEDRVYSFDVCFDVKGRNGPFINKQFYLDDDKLDSVDACINIMYELNIIMGDYIYVYETFDHNKPDVLVKIIEDLKKGDK